jgi:hypothetical protein
MDKDTKKNMDSIGLPEAFDDMQEIIGERSG